MTTTPSGRFGADPAYVAWLGSRILRTVSEHPPRRVLDIGCGDGSLLLYLADALSSASLVGVDLSAANIAAATERVQRSPHRGRVAVKQHDFLSFEDGRFDLLVASSSLQGIAATTDQVAAAIARGVAPGARFVQVTPYRCAYNAALNTVRRLLRPMRGTLTDHMILGAARLVHRDQPRARLVERIDYMYLVLRHDEEGIRRALERRGFTLDAIEDAPHTSVAQPKQRLAIMTGPGDTLPTR